jgi:dihydrofolate reductase
MRKVIVFNLISLDGYACGPAGDLMALPFGESFDAYCAERLDTAHTLLWGRSTFDMFRGFWPAVQDDETATDDQRAISRGDNTLEKVIVSDTLTADETDPWGATTRIVQRADAHAEVAAMREQDGGDILVFGSVTLWHDLLAHGLVDEVHVMVGAVVVGGGLPALPTGASLSLIDIRRVEGDDRVLLQYRVRQVR